MYYLVILYQKFKIFKKNNYNLSIFKLLLLIALFNYFLILQQ